MDIHSAVLFAGVVLPSLWDSFQGTIVFLYFGPETILPVASILAGIIGVILMFWRYVLSLVRKSFRLLFRRNRARPELRIDPDVNPKITAVASSGKVSQQQGK